MYRYIQKKERESPFICSDLQGHRIHTFFWFIPQIFIKHLIYALASLVAQTVKNLPAMRETQVRSLGQEDPLEKEMATHPLQYSCLENPMDKGFWGAIVH